MNKDIFEQVITDFLKGKNYKASQVFFIRTDAEKVINLGHRFIEEVALRKKLVSSSAEFNPNDTEINNNFYAGVTKDCDVRIDKHNAEDEPHKCWPCGDSDTAIVVEDYFQHLGCQGEPIRRKEDSSNFYLYLVVPDVTIEKPKE